MKTAAWIVLLSSLVLQESPPKPLAIGASAPEFDLPGVDDKRHALKDFADKKLLLVLFDTVHCPTSQRYTARILKIAEDYRDKGVGIVAISPSDPKSVRLDELGYTDLDDSFPSMKLRAREKGFTFPFCYDGEPNLVSQAYGPQATPHAFLFDADRKLRYHGGIDDNEYESKAKVPHLRNALDALLAGNAVPVETTKVYGCSTKWPAKRKEVEAYNVKIAAEPVTLDAAEPEAVKALRRNDSKKVRLIHVWSTADASRIPALVAMNHMYRRRNFQFATIAVQALGEIEAALAALRKPGPAASNTNLLMPGNDAVRKALDVEWDGTLPFTLLVSDTNDVLFSKTGNFDELELKRAIVNNLKVERR